MIIRMLRLAAWPALLAALVPAGCNSTPASAQVFITSYIQGVSSGTCPFASQTPWINIGVATGNSPTTVADQGNQGGGQVSASCGVKSNGSNFDIQLNAALSNTGSITIVSSMSMPISPTGGGMGVTGTFESGTLGRYTSNNCSITYKYNNGNVPVSPPIAGGRIWAHLSCVDSQRGDLSFMAPDGGTTPATCDTEADFLFENCAD
jgi:hypothetical protein